VKIKNFKYLPLQCQKGYGTFSEKSKNTRRFSIPEIFEIANLRVF